MIPKKVSIHKKIGETPLEALGRFRTEQIEAAQKNNDSVSASNWQTIPMTYAGRLDPMAEGELLILIGDECKNKEKYLGLDKEYEVEIVFGISTDTGDALGIPTISNRLADDSFNPQKINLQKYVGKFSQPYPAYSSKTVNGKQLHELARANQLPEEMPKRKVEIYTIELLKIYNITGGELKNQILNSISLIKGDFRQEEIVARWNEALNDSKQLFDVIKIKVECSGGTYMRSLATKIANDAGTKGFAIGIKRTRIS